MHSRPNDPSEPPATEAGFSPALPRDGAFEHLASPAWMLDRKGVVVGANRAARALEREAGIALPLWTPGSRHILEESTEMRRALEEGRSLEVCVRGHGPRQRLRVVLEPLRNPDGSPQGALLVAPEAARAGRTRSLFARVLGGATREMQTPLARLSWFRRLADQAAARGDMTRVQVYLKRLRRHERRLEYLLAELRELLQILSGEMPLHPSPFDLVALLRRAVDEAAPTARDHIFEIAAPAELTVVADEERIARIVEALLSNAVRFSPRGGRVAVGLESTPTRARISVTDSGDGIPGERLAELFDGPCWDQETPPGGLGLALYLTREVIELHRGSIRAERAPGSGTLIAIELPRVFRG